MEAESKGKLPATAGQRSIYREISGADLPAGATRTDAVKAIKRALAVQLRVEGALASEEPSCSALKAPRREATVGRTGPRSIVSDRLLVVTDEEFESDHLQDITLLINLGELEQMAIPPKGAALFWDAGDNVDEKVLEGVVRLIASTMRGLHQRVLIVGTAQAIATVAACTLKEYAGADERCAISAVRRSCGGDSFNAHLLETIHRYRVS